MKAKLTFLGTGTSQGVPMIACDCPVCKSDDPRDRRLRSSVMVEYGDITVIVDAGPDFREQMLRAGVRHIDGILLTHDHKDHTGGLDDVRGFNLLERHPVNIYCEKRVHESLKSAYAYAFATPRYQGAPEFNVKLVDGQHPFTVTSNRIEEVIVWERGFGYRHFPPEFTDGPSIEVIPIQGWHHKNKDLSVLGYRFGDIAYLTDFCLVEDGELEKLKGLKAVTLGCVKRDTHYAHFGLQECLDFFEKVGAKDSYITHISHLLPACADFEKELPEGVHPAWDGLVIE